MSLPFTLYQLRILRAIVTEKSFTRAAKILFISQPTLSKQIKTLEKQLGIKLIIRSKNEISLTDA
jgi:DNA-binding transcriptional LysR family regulator